MLHIFQYDQVNDKLELNRPEILLIKEFAALMDNKRNICPEDKTGKEHLRAYKEFTYIYLATDLLKSEQQLLVVFLFGLF